MSNKSQNIIEAAQAFATEKHKDQWRRDKVTPYISHVARVAQLTELFGGGVLSVVVAWLHDVVEDCQVKLSEIEHTFGKPISEAVDALTHRKGETYPESIERARNNGLAWIVKIADNLANLSDKPSEQQVQKYSASLITLLTVNHEKSTELLEAERLFNARNP